MIRATGLGLCRPVLTSQPGHEHKGCGRSAVALDGRRRSLPGSASARWRGDKGRSAHRGNPDLEQPTGLAQTLDRTGRLMIPKRTPKRVTGSSPWQNRRPGLRRISRSSRSSAFSFPSRAGSHRPVSVEAPGLRSASNSLTPRANRRGHRAIPTRQLGRSEADTTRPPHGGAPLCSRQVPSFGAGPVDL